MDIFEKENRENIFKNKIEENIWTTETNGPVD